MLPTALTVVCPHMGAGGMQRVVATLVNAWAEKGWNVTIITLHADEIFYTLDRRVNVLSLPTWERAGIGLKIIDGTWAAIASVYVNIRAFAMKLFANPNPTPWPRPLQVLAQWCKQGASLGANSATRLLSMVWRDHYWQTIWKLHVPVYFRVKALRRALHHLGAYNVISFCGSANIASVIACQKLPSHLVISERNDPARQKLSFPWNALRPHFYGQADVVTANTREALDVMGSYVDPHRLTFVPNPLTMVGEAAQDGTTTLQGPRVLIVGRLHLQKAHEVLFRAFARLPTDLDPWRLSIVGMGGEEAPLRSLAENLGIQDRLDWHGQVDDPRPYYRAASFLALPSRHEGSPNVLLEAMGFGLATIVTDASPGPLELIEHDRNGLIVPVDNPTALAKAIEHLARAPEECNRLGAAAKDTIHGLGRDVPSIVAHWEALLDPEKKTSHEK